MGAAGASVTWDSNVFRLPDSLAGLAPNGRFDRTSAMYAGLRIDKPYAQQRVLLDATGTAYRHDRFSYLDFDALDYRGAWQWHVTPRVSGVLSAERSQALVNYADFRNITQRNVRTAENRRASVDWLMFGGWHLVGAASHQEWRTSLPIVDQGSFRATAAEAGVKYFAPSANAIGFNLRSLEGRYTDRPLDPVNFLGDGFRRTETELTASWIATGRSSLDAHLKHIEHRENHFPQRDFSGTAAALGFHWSPAGRLTLGVDAARELTPWRDDTATYKADNRLSLGPVWQLSARVVMKMHVVRGTSDYRQPLVALAGPARHDSFRSEQLAIEWGMQRNVSLTASLQRQRRSSSAAGLDFSDSIATLGVSLLF